MTTILKNHILYNFSFHIFRLKKEIAEILLFLLLLFFVS